VDLAAPAKPVIGLKDAIRQLCGYDYGGKKPQEIVKPLAYTDETSKRPVNLDLDVDEVLEELTSMAQLRPVSPIRDISIPSRPVAPIRDVIIPSRPVASGSSCGVKSTKMGKPVARKKKGKLQIIKFFIIIY